MMDQNRNHLVIGKSLLIACIFFSITIIGENSTYIPSYIPDSLPIIDSLRLKSILSLEELQTKLNRYELKRLPNR